ncbi:MAG: PAS domain S-box protein [Theionarchaea archaeon]|nr:PAS domain S-box protein [Theionarchaea archaeon]MBU7038879.1 PAS domain S-box protein [Theionarchaea archaeon]
MTETHTRGKLKELEERYRALFDRTLYCVYINDFDGNILDANETALNLLGYTKDEIPSLNFSALLDSDQLEAVREATRNLLESGFRESPVEYRLRKKDGSSVWVEAEASLLFRDGKPYAIQGIAKDITEQKMTLEALRESEEKYRSLTTNLNVGVYRNVPGPQGWFIEANPAVVKMFGYASKNEFLELSVCEIFQNPEDRDLLDKKISKEGFVKGEELLLKKRDGSTFVGSVSAVAVKGNDGRTLYHDGIIEDISERKHSQKELEDSEEKYRTLVEQSLQGIVIVRGIPPRPVFVNPAVAEMSGYSSQEILSFSSEEMTSLIHPQDQKRLFRDYQRRLRGEKPSPHFEMRIVRQDGELRWLEAHSRLITYSGEPAVQAIFVDVTERKRAEEKIRTLNLELKERIEERSTRIEMLLNARQRLQVEKNWEKGLREIVETMENLGFDHTGIFLVNRVRKSLVFHSGTGIDLPDAGTAVPLSDSEHFGVRCVLDKRTIHIKDASSAEGSRIGPGPSSFVWIPIMVQNEAFAALAAGNFRKDNPVNEEDVKDLEILASMCGNFIDRTSLLVEPAPEELTSTKIRYWIDPSEGYTVLEKKPERSLKIFQDLVTHGIPGFVISREYPEKVRRKYNLMKTPILWLSRFEVDDALSPDDLPKLIYIVKDFTKKCEESVVFLDGLEYLITQIGFDTVMKYVEELKDIVVTNKSRLIVPVHRGAISDREFSILEKEFVVMTE